MDGDQEPWLAFEYTWTPNDDGADPIPFFVVVADESHGDRVAWLMVALARANVNH